MHETSVQSINQGPAVDGNAVDPSVSAFDGTAGPRVGSHNEGEISW